MTDSLRHFPEFMAWQKTPLPMHIDPDKIHGTYIFRGGARGDIQGVMAYYRRRLEDHGLSANRWENIDPEIFTDRFGFVPNFANAVAAGYLVDRREEGKGFEVSIELVAILWTFCPSDLPWDPDAF